MKKKLKVLVLFDGIGPTKIDQDLSKEMKTEDWKTEANLLTALGALGYTAEHLAIFDDLDLLRQKLESFAPDVIFNLADPRADLSRSAAGRAEDCDLSCEVGRGISQALGLAESVRRAARPRARRAHRADM